MKGVELRHQVRIGKAKRVRVKDKEIRQKVRLLVASCIQPVGTERNDNLILLSSALVSYDPDQGKKRKVKRRKARGELN